MWFNREKREVCTKGREFPNQQDKQQVFAGSEQRTWKTAISQLLELSDPFTGSKRERDRLFTLLLVREQGRKETPTRGLLPPQPPQRDFRAGKGAHAPLAKGFWMREEGTERAERKPGSAAGADKSPFSQPLVRRLRRAHRKRPMTQKPPGQPGPHRTPTSFILQLKSGVPPSRSGRRWEEGALSSAPGCKPATWVRPRRFPQAAARLPGPARRTAGQRLPGPPSNATGSCSPAEQRYRPLLPRPAPLTGAQTPPSRDGRGAARPGPTASA